MQSTMQGRWHVRAARLIDRAVIGRVLVVTAALLSGAQGAPAADPPPGVGQELKRNQEGILNPTVPVGGRAVPNLPPPEVQPLTWSAGSGPTQTIERVVVRGDVALLDAQGLTKRLADSLVGRPWNQQAVARVVEQANRTLITNGFYAATLRLPRANACTNGVVTVDADAGRVGHRHFAFGKNRQDGRFFSKRQLDKRFADMPEGSIFNYNTFYDRFYGLNAHPDITADVDLRIRDEEAAERSMRYVDMDLSVQESIPLHFVIDVDNYSSQMSQEGGDSSGLSDKGWEVSLLLQYLNLCKVDDVLTLDFKTSIDSTLLSLAGSYYLPHDFGLGGGFTVFGGYSELSETEVAPSINVSGTGYFLGMQYSQHIRETPDSEWTIAGGPIYREMENTLKVASIATEPQTASVMPVSLSLIYSSKRVDALGGRNYATLEALANAGSSGSLQDLRQKAEDTYAVLHAQYARLQTLMGREDPLGNRVGQWTMFFRLFAQYANGPLIPAEQIGLGGANSIRGYSEREFLGDDGFYFNLELRTPMLLGLVSRPFSSDSYRKAHAANPWDRVQFLWFLDGGYEEIQQPLPSEIVDRQLLSTGPGLRLAMTQYAQLKLDYGIPLMQPDGATSSSGYAHIDLQVQF